ncbi:hypothetical protein TL16_g00050 [Triparma laevis f. inornata]|uniref:Uncharacterized protein n=2 Tax=Triparma laevis TaxID=1534972 RepID=A0A9W7CN90_9STRA|nr:hypothetical protein TL16_g00050 [Triparma laevis f. inornata]GMI07784.1 hypothetical protein TrLO_g11558 [Triparma laevis f. longispina]
MELLQAGSEAFNEACTSLDNFSEATDLNEIEELLETILSLVSSENHEGSDEKKSKRVKRDSETQAGLLTLQSRTLLLLGQLIEHKDHPRAFELYSKSHALAAKIPDGDRASVEPCVELGRYSFKYAVNEQMLDGAKHHLARAIELAGVCASEGVEDSDSDSDSEDDVAAAGREAKMYLARLICQSSASDDQARKHLLEMKFKYRLSQPVIRSFLSTKNENKKVQTFVGAWDDVYSPELLKRLQSSFLPNSPFFKEHNYNSPSCGYFSYKLPLPLKSTDDVLTSAISRVFRAVSTRMPKVKNSTWVEWWCHSRHHNDGHSLHYDYIFGDGKGGEGARHPLASTVSYLEADCGGPTLITDQTMSQSQSSFGYKVKPKQNRLLCFEGNRLHCVLPGSELPPSNNSRRVTLMIAFWELDPGAPSTPEGRVEGESGLAWPGVVRSEYVEGSSESKSIAKHNQDAILRVDELIEDLEHPKNVVGPIDLLDDEIFTFFGALNSGLVIAKKGVCSLNCGGKCEVCRQRAAS